MFSSHSKSPKTVFISSLLILISLSMFGLLVFTDYFTISRTSASGRKASAARAKTSPQTGTPNHQRTFGFPQLTLTSDFPTGNLHDAVSIDKHHYSLQAGMDPLDPIGHGKKHKNWFHFQAKSSFTAQKSIKFTIHNLEKNWAIWTHGCALAYQSSLAPNNNWQVLNTTELKVLIRAKGMALEFVYTFGVGEEAAFAFSFPYGRAQLGEYLNATEAAFKRLDNFVFRRETLVRSNLGFPIEILTMSDSGNITDHLVPKMGHLFPGRGLEDRTTATPNFVHSKRVFVVSARVHPSEAAGSYVLEGLIDRLKTQDDATRTFFRNSVLYVIPMLNPDGVELGFTRCDANGFNLNARYNDADIHTPSIYALKKFIRYQNSRARVRMFLDLHAHFTRRGFFTFGNPLRPKNYRSVLEFPFIIRGQTPHFSVTGSRFGSKRVEESTSRKELFKLTKLRNVYTVEVNYWGGKSDRMSLKSNKLIQNNLRKVSDFSKFYTPETFRRFGKSLADSLFKFDQFLTNPTSPERTKMFKKMDRFYERFTRRRNKPKGKLESASKPPKKDAAASTRPPAADAPKTKGF
jgi:hypothetical protein